MSKICLTGCGGFIGSHLCKYLKSRGYWVRGVDIKEPEFDGSYADEFIIRDLRYPSIDLFEGIDEVYHLAADMGGIGYIESNRADITFNNTLIDMLTLKACQECGVKKFLYTSSACVYPGHYQNSEFAQELLEEDAYPADAEDGYGWEKLMMERACNSFMEDYGLSVRIARFHNIYGPLGTYDGGKEKSPAALCRKIAKLMVGDTLKIWGDGNQTRSYCYIEDCVEGLYNLMQSDYSKPINIGTNRLVSINELADIILKIAGKVADKEYDLTKPQGVRGRNANINRANEILGWTPKTTLEEGLENTYRWIYKQIYR
jgi:GDP-D-mannose 3', 5'-epimerase